jgi:hypothetical protein
MWGSQGNGEGDGSGGFCDGSDGVIFLKSSTSFFSFYKNK